jgi:polar amino acid transport system substrate-binding protein
MIIKNIIVFLLLVSSLFANRLDNINSRGFIKVGVYYDYAPFGYVNSKNKLVGFEIDLAKEIAKQMGVKARFFQINSENKLNRLNKDRIDIILGATTHSNFADKYIDFTNPYFYNGQAFLARKNFRFKSNISFFRQKDSLCKGISLWGKYKKADTKSKIS